MDFVMVPVQVEVLHWHARRRGWETKTKAPSGQNKSAVKYAAFASAREIVYSENEAFFTYEFTFHAYDKLFFITAIIHRYFTLHNIFLDSIVMYKGPTTFSRETYITVQLLES